MPVYKLSFLGTQIFSIREAEQKIHFEGKMYLEQDQGRLIFAIVNASNEVEASRMVLDEVARLQMHVPGQLKMFSEE